MAPRTHTSLSSRFWWRLLVLAAFLLPAVTALPYDPARTGDLVRAVLQSPFIVRVPELLPVAKAALVLVAVLPFLRVRWAGRALMGYYAAILVVVAFGQNMAQTERFGSVWLVGNTVVQLVVAAWCLRDVAGGRTVIGAELLRRRRLWLLVPMLVAWAMPYGVHDGRVVPSMATVLSNEAGVTYCMITPVVLGVLLLCPDGADHRTLSMASYVGLLFGLVNVLTWFVLGPQDWWMGVLHLPLVLTAVLGLVEARHRHERTPAGA